MNLPLVQDSPLAPDEPARWFGPAKAGWDTKDLIPEGWERI